MKNFKLNLIITFLCVFLCNFPTLKAESNKIDSLRNIIDNSIPPDSSTVDLLFMLSESYFSISIDSGLAIDKRALELANRINYKAGIRRSYARIGRWYMYRGDFEESKRYYHIALNEGIKHSDSSYISNCYILLGNLFLKNKEVPDSVYFYFNKFNSIPDKFKSPINIYINYRNLFHIYSFYGMYEKATETFSKLKNILHDKDISALYYTEIYSGLGLNHLYNGNYEQAEIFFLEAKKYEDDVEKTNELWKYYSAVNDNNLSAALTELNKFDEALRIARRALKVSIECNYKEVELYVYNNLSLLYRNAGDIDSSDYYLNKLGDDIKLAQEELVVGYYSGLFANNLLKGNRDTALLYLSKMENLFNEIQYPVLKAITLKAIVKIFKEKGDYKNAFKYSEFANMLGDSIKSEQNRLNLSFLQTDFEVDKKNREIEYLTTESKLQKTINKKNKLLFFLILSTLTTLLISLVFMVLAINRKKKTTEILLRKNEELSNQKYQTLYKESQIMAIREKIAGQEDERARIARELHDGVAGSLTSIKYRFNYLEGSNPTEELDQIKNSISTVLEEVRTISHNLLPPQFSDVSIFQVLNNHIREINKTTQQQFSIQFFPNVGWDNLPTDIQVELYRIVQELCSNISKHSDATKVEIQLTQNDGAINLTIEDDGKSFEYNDNGIGYVNIRKRVSQYNGVFEKSSSSINGNCLMVQLPLNIYQQN